MATNEGGPNQPVDDGLNQNGGGKAGNGAPLTWLQQPGFFFKTQTRLVEIALAGAAIFLFTRMR